jgi:hypothetical protein
MFDASVEMLPSDMTLGPGIDLTFGRYGHTMTYVRSRQEIYVMFGATPEPLFTPPVNPVFVLNL